MQTIDRSMQNRWARRLLVALLFAFAATIGCSGSRSSPQHLRTTEIKIGNRAIAVEAALNDAERQTGMMFRKSLGADEGMLFVFPDSRKLYFYMRNTYVPLDIAFLRSDGVVINIAQMEPLTETTHESRLPARMALEMPLNWFEKNGVKEGDKIEFSAKVLDKAS